MLSPIAPDALQQRLASGGMLLIDIREPDEYAREHIIGARLIPLNAIDAEDLTTEHGRAVCFTCRSGNRTAIAAARLLAKGFPESYALTGGLDGWKKAGLPVHCNPRAPLDLDSTVPVGIRAQIDECVIAVTGDQRVDRRVERGGRQPGRPPHARGARARVAGSRVRRRGHRAGGSSRRARPARCPRASP